MEFIAARNSTNYCHCNVILSGHISKIFFIAITKTGSMDLKLEVLAVKMGFGIIVSASVRSAAFPARPVYLPFWNS